MLSCDLEEKRQKADLGCFQLCGSVLGIQKNYCYLSGKLTEFIQYTIKYSVKCNLPGCVNQMIFSMFQQSGERTLLGLTSMCDLRDLQDRTYGMLPPLLLLGKAKLTELQLKCT